MTQELFDTAAGFSSFFSLRTLDQGRDRLVLEATITNQLRNRRGTIHGGVLMTLADIACGRVGLLAAAADGEAAQCVTVTLAMNFVAPAIDGPLVLTARLTGGGRTVFHATCDIVDGAGQLCATAQGVFRRISTGKSPSDKV